MGEDKIQWHPAFCSAVRLELSKDKNVLEYQNEYNLNSKPLQVDLLVIHKNTRKELDNQIGKLFRTYNVMEYKSPWKGVSIDSYFKTIAYACLYKAGGEDVDLRKQGDITISIVQERKPHKLFHILKNMGHTIEKVYEGIYYIYGQTVIFPTQVIVGKELDRKHHVWLKSLTGKLTKDEAQMLIESTNSLARKDDKENADSVLDVTIKANAGIFVELRKEAPEMCEALEELMADVIEKRVKEESDRVTQEVTQQVTQTISKNFAINLLSDGMTIDQVQKYTGLSKQEIKKLQKSL